MHKIIRQEEMANISSEVQEIVMEEKNVSVKERGVNQKR